MGRVVVVSNVRLTMIMASIAVSSGFYPLSSSVSRDFKSTPLLSNLFGETVPPPQPSILDVARPLMDAAIALERAGTTMVSLAGDDRALFDGGTQLVNAARDLEDAGAMARMRPGLFAEEPALKLRGCGEAFQSAATALGVASFQVGGENMGWCGEELGRFDQSTSGSRLSAAGKAIVDASAACRTLQSSSPPENSKEDGGGWLASMTFKMVGAATGTWDDAADDVSVAGRCLETAGTVLSTCRVARRM